MTRGTVSRDADDARDHRQPFRVDFVLLSLSVSFFCAENRGGLRRSVSGGQDWCGGGHSPDDGELAHLFCFPVCNLAHDPY